MKIGGAQKALLSLLEVISPYYDITLLLFCAQGELLSDIPPNIKILEVKDCFRFLGISQKDCKFILDYLFRAFLASIARIISFRIAVHIMLFISRFKKIDTKYDIAISYIHCCAPRNFYGGVVEYVLNMIDSKHKSCFIHCDYIQSGTCTDYSKSLYRKFDSIIGVSKSVTHQFTSVLPDLKDRTYTIYNAINSEKIHSLALEDPFQYNDAEINFLSVSRLSEEKGLDRFIRALGNLYKLNFHYYIIGEGMYRATIEETIQQCKLKDKVTLLGEKSNPYRYMINADLLVVPSYHEAAPVVFQEALCLKLPILSTNTLSAKEMIPKKCGFVVDNTEYSICAFVEKMEYDPALLLKAKKAATSYNYEPNQTYKAFSAIFDSF